MSEAPEEMKTDDLPEDEASMTLCVNQKARALDQAVLTITCDERLNLQDAMFLRGVFAGQYPNRPEFHGHGPTGLVYEHPRIQYKVMNGRGLIVGLQEGAVLLQVAEILVRFRLGSKQVNVTGDSRLRVACLRAQPFYGL